MNGISQILRAFGQDDPNQATPPSGVPEVAQDRHTEAGPGPCWRWRASRACWRAGPGAAGCDSRSNTPPL